MKHSSPESAPPPEADRPSMQTLGLPPARYSVLTAVYTETPRIRGRNCTNNSEPVEKRSSPSNRLWGGTKETDLGQGPYFVVEHLKKAHLNWVRHLQRTPPQREWARSGSSSISENLRSRTTTPHLSLESPTLDASITSHYGVIYLPHTQIFRMKKSNFVQPLGWNNHVLRYGSVQFRDIMFEDV